MATETFPSRAAHQPERDEEFVHSEKRVERDRLVNYSEQKEHPNRRATAVALQVFGDDFCRPGMFFTEAARHIHVPYMVICERQGLVTSYNLFDGDESAVRGLRADCRSVVSCAMLSG